MAADAGIESRTVATLALTARRQILSMARLDLIHWLRLTEYTVPVPGILEPSVSNPVSLNPDPENAESSIRTLDLDSFCVIKINKGKI